MASKKPDPYTSEAEAQSLVRYGPEVSALTALLRQAEEDRDLRLRQAKSGRQYAVGAVDQARPQVVQAYRGAQRAVSPAFAQGGGIEASALQARLGESQALAQSQLAARRVSAIEGEGAAKDAALRDFRSDRGKIGQRAVDLSHEQGAYVASTIGDLIGADAAAKAAARKQQATLGQQERNSLRSAGIDPDTHTPIPNGPLDPKVQAPKKEWRTPQQHADFASMVTNIARYAERYKGKAPRSAIVEKLQAGREGRSGWYLKQAGKWVPVPEGTLGAQFKTLPGIPQFKADLSMSAALDVALDGRLSRETQDRIHAAGLKLNELGLPTYGAWVRDRRRKQNASVQGRAPVAPDSNGQFRPT